MLNAGMMRTLVSSLPEVLVWPELADILDLADDSSRPDWLLPVRACVAVGGSEQDAHTVSAAVACLQLSIMLVDDILDDDPRGFQIDKGPGWAANLALALQSAAVRLVAMNHRDASTAVTLSNIVARIALSTAVGQNMDVQNLTGEEDYWSVVKAKSTPFYGGALELGAVVGGASVQVTNRLYKLGVLIGEIIQIEDDLQDAFQTPANADWIHGRNNLAILYARTAEHGDRELFEYLRLEASDPENLNKAQKILISSGATSYCLYLLVQRYREAHEMLTDIKLANPAVLMTILDEYAESLINKLQFSGIPVSRSILLDGLSGSPNSAM